MKTNPIWWLAALTLSLSPGVSTGAPPSPTPSPALLDSAWAHLTRHVGPSFTARYLSFDSTDATSVQYFAEVRPASSPSVVKGQRTRHLVQPIGSGLPVWRFSFRLRIPEKPWIDESVSVAVDLQGHLTPKRDATGRYLPTGGIAGIGDCAHDSSLCVFPIDEQEAIRIAKQDGLEEGLGPWKTSFHWYYSRDGRFVWVITNTLSDRGPCERSGKSFIIDANTGAVFQRSNWSQIC